MKLLPLGTQTFSLLINNDCVYVDKTRQIHQLLTQGRCYFLSRPRRFGKSLLLSTMAEIFQGNRELFQGLWIHDKLDDWTKHPVIHLDISTVTTGSDPDRFPEI